MPSATAPTYNQQAAAGVTKPASLNTRCSSGLGAAARSSLQGQCSVADLYQPTEDRGERDDREPRENRQKDEGERNDAPLAPSPPRAGQPTAKPPGGNLRGEWELAFLELPSRVGPRHFPDGGRTACQFGPFPTFGQRGSVGAARDSRDRLAGIDSSCNQRCSAPRPTATTSFLVVSPCLRHFLGALRVIARLLRALLF